jgi:nicotinamidase-related amidase
MILRYLLEADMHKNIALLIIDVQKGFDDARWGARNNPLAETQIALLLAKWRAARLPVIHVQHDSTTSNGSFQPGTPGNEPKLEALPLPGEPVYRKTVNSAFIGTSLERDLRGRGIATLVLVGFITNHCVSTTARMAGNLGFKTFVVEDATATFDRMGLDGRLRPAAEVHASALSDLNEEFAEIIDTHAILENILILP